jgi:hypothetical protein
MCAEGFTTGKNSELKAYRGQTNVNIDIQHTNNSILPARRLLSKTSLLLQSREKFRLVV